MKLPRAKQSIVTPFLLFLVLILQLNSLISTPKQYVSQTDIYTKGERGLSAYDLWVGSGHKGTLDDFFISLKGEDASQPTNGINGADGTSYAVPANNGRDGSSCLAPTQDEQGNTTISCAGQSVIIQKPKDGTDGINQSQSHFNQNKETCYLEYKNDSERFWIPLIKDPECFNYGS